MINILRFKSSTVLLSLILMSSSCRSILKFAENTIWTVLGFMLFSIVGGAILALFNENGSSKKK